MRWYSYDPEDGFEVHATAEDARRHAEACMAEHRDCAGDDGWHERIGEVSWGEVVVHATATCVSTRPSPMPDFGAIEKWELRDVALTGRPVGD